MKRERRTGCDIRSRQKEMQRITQVETESGPCGHADGGCQGRSSRLPLAASPKEKGMVANN